MILDLPRFVEAERPYWTELEGILAGIEREPAARMNIGEVERFHYLYERCSADLARMATFSADPDARAHLEALVARAYGEIHASLRRHARPQPLHWFLHIFPQTFRRHLRLFWLSCAITMLGCTFGAVALLADPDAKPALMPFSGLLETPGERVAREEQRKADRLAERRATFSAQLMTHNIRVAVTTMGLGVTWGVGSTVVLFANGVMLGAVSADYLQAGQSVFLLGWLLPHGVVEIPAILMAGQAGFLLAGAVIGWRRRTTRRARLREVSGDLVTLAAGVAILLVWAGLVESFLSQSHRPVLPYELKIGFGVVELLLLAGFLGRAGADGRKR